MIIIELVLIFVLFLVLGRRREGYDVLERNISINDCADTCKTTAGCYGFAFDTDTSNCYLSQDLIIGKPVDALYKQDYKTSNTTCNKYKPITTETQNPTLADRRSNSVYICTESSNLFPQYYFQNNGTFTNLGQGYNIDNIFTVDNYSVNAYTWPNRYVDNNSELTVLRDGLQTQNYNVTQPSDIEKILLDDGSKPINVTQNITPTPDNVFTKIKSDFKNTISKWISPDYVNYNQRDIPTPNNNLIYKLNNKLNSGQYLKPFKCVKNIKQNDCLKECTRNPECVGVEWNPDFDGNSNVCCPYKTIGNFVSRDVNNQDGAFYEKVDNQNVEDDKQNIYVKVF